MSRVDTTIVIEDEPHEELAFKKAIKQFDDWWYSDEQKEIRENIGPNLYSFEVTLIEKTYVYYDFGDRNYWRYTFKAIVER